MAARFFQILAPGVQTVPTDEEAVGQGPVVIFVEELLHFLGQGGDVLVIVKYFDPFAVFVGLDPGQPLEHFIALDGQTTNAPQILGHYGSPHGMSVQDRSHFGSLGEHDVDHGLGRRFSGGFFDRLAQVIDDDKIVLFQATLILAAGGDEQAERFARENGAVIAAGAQRPTQVIEQQAGFHQGFLGKVQGRIGPIQVGTKRGQVGRRVFGRHGIGFTLKIIGCKEFRLNIGLLRRQARRTCSKTSRHFKEP